MIASPPTRVPRPMPRVLLAGVRSGLSAVMVKSLPAAMRNSVSGFTRRTVMGKVAGGPAITLGGSGRTMRYSASFTGMSTRPVLTFT
jgi:hypothetical protein